MSRAAQRGIRRARAAVVRGAAAAPGRRREGASVRRVGAVSTNKPRGGHAWTGGDDERHRQLAVRAVRRAPHQPDTGYVRVRAAPRAGAVGAAPRRCGRRRAEEAGKLREHQHANVDAATGGAAACGGEVEGVGSGGGAHGGRGSVHTRDRELCGESPADAAVRVMEAVSLRDAGTTQEVVGSSRRQPADSCVLALGCTLGHARPWRDPPRSTEER
mmetsp:Transcript_38462/g.61626  ORF Transcript_38462/g.61626 Transcript_38462/m.61626 type:complete len:216 (+) Transcript_38462:294-941(+)